jgi:hypothetical protein
MIYINISVSFDIISYWFTFLYRCLAFIRLFTQLIEAESHHRSPGERMTRLKEFNLLSVKVRAARCIFAVNSEYS